MFQAYVSRNIPEQYGLKNGTVPPFLDPPIPIELEFDPKKVGHSN